MSDNEANWGNKKMTYYSMNKREKDDDSDFVEEEKEAIRLQKKRLDKIKQSKILQEEEEEEHTDQDISNEDEQNQNKSQRAQIQTKAPKKTSYELPETRASEYKINTDEIISDLKHSKLLWSETFEEIHEIIETFNSDDFFELPWTTQYLQSIKTSNLTVIACWLFTSLLKLKNKMTNHHPIIKTTAVIQSLWEKTQSKDKTWNDKIDKIWEWYQTKKEREEETEKEMKLLNRKTKRKGTKNAEQGTKDDFIDSQIKQFNNLKQEKISINNKRRADLVKEIDMKNDFAIRHANKSVLVSKGIVRKRKQYQGNAKLMNREKYVKKEKLRKNMVKEYVGKPDVYGGEVTGIRRDLVRSTAIKS